MDKITLSVAVLSKITAKTKEELLQLTKNEDGTEKEPSAIEAEIASLVNAKIATINGEKDKAVALAIKNNMEKMERLLEKATGIKEYTDFDDIVGKLKDKIAEKGNDSQNKELDAKLKQLADVEARVLAQKQEIENTRKNIERQQLNSKLIAVAEKLAVEKGVMLPKDPAEKAEFLQELIAMKTSGRNVLEKGGKFVFTNEKGEVERDDYHNELTFDAVITKPLSYLPKAEGQQNNAGSNPNGGGGKFNFSEQDLTLEHYPAKIAELRKAGNKEAEKALIAAFDKKYSS